MHNFPDIDGKGRRHVRLILLILGLPALRRPGGGRRRDRRRAVPVLQKGRPSRVLQEARHPKGRRPAAPVQRVRYKFSEATQLGPARRGREMIMQ